MISYHDNMCFITSEGKNIIIGSGVVGEDGKGEEGRLEGRLPLFEKSIGRASILNFKTQCYFQ